MVLGISWTLSYILLPEGFLRGKTLAGLLNPRRDSPAAMFVHVGLWNLLFGYGGVIYMNRFRVDGLPAGYVITWMFWAFYGLLLGTNSFAFPGPAKYAPSFTLLWGRSGFFEISAYTLAAAATARWCLDPIKRSKAWLSVEDIVALLLALGLLIFAVWRETWHLYLNNSGL